MIWEVGGEIRRLPASIETPVNKAGLIQSHNDRY